MSYPPISHYYGSGSNQQTPQRGYGVPQETTSVYQNGASNAGDGRQGQYGANTYDWSGQTRTTPTPTPTPNPNPPYIGDSWQDRSSGVTNSYNQQRPYYASSESVTTAAPSHLSRDAYSRHNTQGLSNLAYASGLGGQQTSGSTDNHHQHGQAGGRYATSESGSSTQHRVNSPAQGHNRYQSKPAQPQRRQQLPPPQPHYSQSENESSSEANQNLALDAAAALAGVMQGQYPQQSSHQTSTSNPARIIGPPQQAYTGATQSSSQSAYQRPSSPYSVVSNRDQGPLRPNKLQSGATDKTQSIPKADQARPKSRRAANPQPKKPAPASNTPQQTPISNPSSIANLVSAPGEPGQAIYETAENQSTMPNYIDPTQVFNPYHREHERKKREAAEAELRRQAEVERVAAGKQVNVDDATKKASETSTAANSKSKVTKKSNVVAPNMEQRQSSQTPSAASTGPVLQEETMANELKFMMSKMKEFRSSNPALFQKLWNDMRSGAAANANANANASGGTVASATAVVQSPSPQVNQASLVVEADKTVTPSSVLSKPLSRLPSKASSKKPDFPYIPSSVPRNGFKVIVEDNPEGLPDIGRFPAERRIRQTYAKGKGEKSNEAQQPDAAGTPALANVDAAPPRPQDPTTIWPEPRRRAVADATIQFMHTVPENSNVRITPREICSILEQNPSYMDLCVTLEQCGFKFHRSMFARELLKSVPELSPSAARASVQTNQEINTIAIIAQGPSPPAPLNASPAIQASDTSHPLRVVQGATVKDGPNGQIIHRSVPVYVTEGVRVPEAEYVVKPVTFSPRPRASAITRPEPPAGSKEAAARKRDFAELINLTGLDNNENYVLPRKEPRIDTISTSERLENPQIVTQSGFINGNAPLKFDPQSLPPSQWHSHPPPLSQAYQAAYRAYAPPPQNAAQTPQYPYPAASSTEKKARIYLAKKTDKSAAMQKTFYDPKTVARDVLIASGRHPSERPLNVHFASMLGKFIEVDSDLSTFDWDAVDPGGPPVPWVEYVNIPVLRRKFGIDQRDRRRTSVIDKTRDPKGVNYPTPERLAANKAASSHASSPAPSQRKNDSARQDYSHSSKRQKIRHNRVGTEDRREEDLNSRKISIDIPVQLSQRSSRSVSRVNNDAKPMQVDSPPLVKRRGRPPGSKNKNPSFAGLRQQAQATMVETVEEAPAPILHTYKCKWIRCTAELHNLDTLKLHIPKKHCPSAEDVHESGYICWWKKCQYLAPDEDGKIAPVRTFEDRDKWLKHIEEDHVQPIADKFGDGPKSNHTGKPTSREMDHSSFLYKPPVRSFARIVSYTDPQSVENARTRYLSDEHGRMTTPPVTSDGNLDLPSDTMILTQVYSAGTKSEKSKADGLAQSAFMKARGNKSGDTRKVAEEVLRAMESRKQKIGPGVDRGGCTLINEARRDTFMQSPGISRVVDADY